MDLLADAEEEVSAVVVVDFLIEAVLDTNHLDEVEEVVEEAVTATPACHIPKSEAST